MNIQIYTNIHLRSDWDLFSNENCVMVNENDESMIDLTIKQFNELYK